MKKIVIAILFLANVFSDSAESFRQEQQICDELLKLGFLSGDLIFLSPPKSSRSDFENAILETGNATISWLKRNGYTVKSHDVSR